MKYCWCCKSTKSKNDFHRDSARKDGFNGRCKSCNKKYHRLHRRTETARYGSLKRTASAKNINMVLSKEQYYEIISKECFYCNNPLDRTTGGYFLDRLDSALGYTKENCVSCCTTCNFMKGVMSLDNFYKQIELIYKAYEKKR